MVDQCTAMLACRKVLQYYWNVTRAKKNVNKNANRTHTCCEEELLLRAFLFFGNLQYLV